MKNSKMSQQEIVAFLEEPILAHLVTSRPDGRQHVAPIYYMHQNGTVFFIARRNAVKIHNILNNPKVTLSVANNDSPYRYVIIEGEAEVSKGNLLERATQIVARYRGWEHGQARARDYIGQGCLLVEVKIRRLTARSY